LVGMFLRCAMASVASVSSGASRKAYQKESIWRMYALVWKMPGITVGSWIRKVVVRRYVAGECISPSRLIPARDCRDHSR
jgi:hypothetical protein